MELRAFITTTLSEIQTGVQDAIDLAIKNGTKGAINPSWGAPVTASLIEKVQFDIAVTVADTSAGNAEGGIKVVGIHVGGGVADTQERSHVSRIQFSIPLIPPTTRIGDAPSTSVHLQRC